MTNIEQSTINGKSIDGVLGIRTLDCSFEGADESTELYGPLFEFLSLPFGSCFLTLNLTRNLPVNSSNF